MLNVGVLFIAQQSFTATFYSDYYEGKKAANGSIFRQSGLTAASNVYKLGTKVKVTNATTGKSVTVKITDRLAKRFSHKIDLSKTAFRQIASLEKGYQKVIVEVVES
ncbi:septal ring lytic transglycosylase RlpA family protein [Chryseobacterium phage MA9V-2]|nr:septal ring lytic transglycosylase RlpA family protein [Chryseobacterium phage MA9V-2]